MQTPHRVRTPAPNEAQLKAIMTLDDDLLVSAGAGSGKTWVLTERYMEMLVRGVRPSQIVAITFTELAAAEMKRRIRGTVQKWMDQTNDFFEKKRIRQIYEELDSAIISTIHGFCMRIIKEHPVEAEIDPMAEMLKPEEGKQLLEQSVAELLEDTLQNRFEEVTPLYLAWGGRRGIVESLLDAYEAVQTFNYPIQQILLDTENSFAKMEQEIGDTVEQIEKVVNVTIRPELDSLLIGSKKKPPQYALHMESWLIQWQEKSGLLRTWDGVSNQEVGQTVRALVKTIWRKSGSEALKEAHQLLKDRLLPRLIRLERGPDAMDRVRVFCGLLEELDTRYKEKKARRNALDFHDLERLSANILEQHPEVAETYSNRFRYAMIDEFQDTNRLQVSILNRIAGSEGKVKLFLVGDGKQSIYKFRGADVDVFQEIENKHRDKDDRLIDMGVNFRTQGGIIHYINDFFANLMQSAETEHVKQVRFTPLIPARNPEHDNPCVEILVQQTEEDEDARLLEADLIARRIREMVDGQMPLVYRKKSGEVEETAVPVRYGDIAMLYSAITQLAVYEQALQRYGIPYQVEKGRNFYQKQEIIDICSWLSAIVDSLDEVALAALLRSPVMALSDETLFWLAQTGSIREGLVAVATGHSADSVKLQSHLGKDEFAKTIWAGQKLIQWQKICRLRPLSDFLRFILKDSGYLQVILAGFAGEQRYANVLKLVDLAEELQRREGYGIDEFLQYVKQMQADEVQETEAQLKAGAEVDAGAVRLMTVHASKGLEFPVVILPDLKRPLQTGDATRCLIRPHFGMGLKGTKYGDTAAEGELEVQGDGLFHFMKEQENERELLEEHRKLYVAMTRARDYLMLVAVKPKKATRSWQRWIREHAGFAKWEDISAGIYEKGDAAAGTDYKILVNTDVGQPDEKTGNNKERPWEKWLKKAKAAVEGTNSHNGRENVSQSENRTDGERGLLFPVGKPDSVDLSMISASAIMTYRTCPRRFFLKYIYRLPELEDTEISWRAEKTINWESEKTDDGTPGIHADIRGTLVHEAFEQLRNPADKQAVIQQCLQTAKGIEAKDRQSVEEYLDKLADLYLQSPWFHPDSYREQAFYIKIASTLLHGFIDVIVPEADGSLTVVDFKTNEIFTDEHLAELVEKYSLQLQLYAIAANALFQKPVKRAVIFFLSVNQSIEVNVQADTLTYLKNELEQTCVTIMNSCNIRTYVMTEERAICGKCGYRTLCGRNESVR